MNQELTDLFGGGDDSDSEDSEGNCLEAGTDLDSTQRISQLLLSRPAACGVMAFHNGTEEALLLFVERSAKRGSPASVLHAIDSFCYGRHWMMHCGDKKVKYLEKALQLARSKANTTVFETNRPVASSQLVCLEIGSYCGYSAVQIASTFGSSDNEFLYCIENDARCVEYTQRMIDFAGLSSKVQVILGSISSSHSLFLESGFKDMLISKHQCDHLDVLFIDHDKAQYLDDLIRIESCGLLSTGSVVVADNVLSFGQPLEAYLEHVRCTTENGLYSSSELHMCYIEYSNSDDYIMPGEGSSLGNCDSDSCSEIDGLEISIFR